MTDVTKYDAIDMIWEETMEKKPELLSSKKADPEKVAWLRKNKEAIIKNGQEKFLKWTESKP